MPTTPDNENKAKTVAESIWNATIGKKLGMTHDQIAASAAQPTTPDNIDAAEVSDGFDAWWGRQSTAFVYRNDIREQCHIAWQSALATQSGEIAQLREWKRIGGEYSDCLQRLCMDTLYEPCSPVSHSWPGKTHVETIAEAIDFLLEKITKGDAEIAELRESLRWRDAEKEPPTRDGTYLVKTIVVYGAPFLDEVALWQSSDKWGERNVYQWMPIPPG